MNSQTTNSIHHEDCAFRNNTNEQIHVLQLDFEHWDYKQQQSLITLVFSTLNLQCETIEERVKWCNNYIAQHKKKVEKEIVERFGV